MERNHYIHYTAADLLDDGPFLDSMQHPTEQSEDFWARLEKEDSDFAKELHMARRFFKIVAGTEPVSWQKRRPSKFFKDCSRKSSKADDR